MFRYCCILFFLVTFSLDNAVGYPSDQDVVFTNDGGEGNGNNGAIRVNYDIQSYEMLSLGVWIKTTCGSCRYVIMQTDSNNDDDEGTTFGIKDDHLFIEIFDTVTNSLAGYQMTGSIPNDEWVYVLFSRTEENIYFYVYSANEGSGNGERQDIPAFSFGESESFIIGAGFKKNGGLRNGFSREMDELRIWNATYILREGAIEDIAIGDNQATNNLLFHFDFEQSGFQPSFPDTFNAVNTITDSRFSKQQTSFELPVPTGLSSPTTQSPTEDVIPPTMATEVPSEATTEAPTEVPPVPSSVPGNDTQPPVAPIEPTLIPLTADFFTPVVVYGDLALNPNHTLTFHSHGVLNVTGCFDPSGSSIVVDTGSSRSEDVELTLIRFNCSSAVEKGFSSITVGSNDKCIETKHKDTWTSTKFSMLISTKNKCWSWWVYFLIVMSCILVVAIAIGIAVVVKKVPSVTKNVIPYYLRTPKKNGTAVEVA